MPSPVVRNEHGERVGFEFIIEVTSATCRWFPLPWKFREAMRDAQPLHFLVRAEGCPHGAMLVEAHWATTGDLFLSHGWKVLARGRKLVPGDFILFRYDGGDALTLKFFCMHGDRKE